MDHALRITRTHDAAAEQRAAAILPDLDKVLKQFEAQYRGARARFVDETDTATSVRVTIAAGGDIDWATARRTLERDLAAVGLAIESD